MITSVDSCMLSQILCNLMDCNQPFSSTHGIFQARIPKQVAISFLHGIFQSRDGTYVSCIDRQILYLLSHWIMQLSETKLGEGQDPRAEEVEELRGQGQQADGSPTGYKNHQKYFCLKYSQGYN